jgi:hypothetical protein
VLLAPEEHGLVPLSLEIDITPMMRNAEEKECLYLLRGADL